ncbi:hypothetical protein EJ08DRAFT_662102 [Tothia fuscella]|uniref:Uncharacterized protein n=1 Tax=Tothia fuscella TaxID=1048955 RepID=A0A9P4TWV7_9PEZI|nr:hypothetical protein EJ08DRAFT_662102 [Tothia fuscella]
MPPKRNLPFPTGMTTKERKGRRKSGTADEDSIQANLPESLLVPTPTSIGPCQPSILTSSSFSNLLLNLRHVIYDMHFRSVQQDTDRTSVTEGEETEEAYTVLCRKGLLGASREIRCQAIDRYFQTHTVHLASLSNAGKFFWFIGGFGCATLRNLSINHSGGLGPGDAHEELAVEIIKKSIPQLHHLNICVNVQKLASLV